MSTLIETDRATLRPFTPADDEAVYAFGSHPEVNRYTGDNGKYLWYKMERSDFDALAGQ